MVTGYGLEDSGLWMQQVLAATWSSIKFHLAAAVTSLASSDCAMGLDGIVYVGLVGGGSS